MKRDRMMEGGKICSHIQVHAIDNYFAVPTNEQLASETFCFLTPTPQVVYYTTLEIFFARKNVCPKTLGPFFGTYYY